MLEDDLKALTEAIRANTEVRLKTAGMMASVSRELTETASVLRAVLRQSEARTALTGKNADCLIIDDPIPGLDLAPVTVTEPVLTVPAPAPAPAAPAPAAPAPAAPAPAVPTVTVPAKSTAPTFVTGPAPAPAPAAPAPAPAAPAAPAPVAPAPAPADPIPSNYKDAKTLGLRMAAEGHSDVLKEFLASCGVKKLIDLPHDRYGDYYRYFKDRGLL